MLKSEADKNLPLRQICAAMRWQRSRRLGVPRTVVYLNEDEPWRKLWSELMLRKRGMRLRQPKLAGRRGSVSRGGRRAICAGSGSSDSITLPTRSRLKRWSSSAGAKECIERLERVIEEFVPA